MVIVIIIVIFIIIIIIIIIAIIMIIIKMINKTMWDYIIWENNYKAYAYQEIVRDYEILLQFVFHGNFWREEDDFFSCTYGVGKIAK